MNRTGGLRRWVALGLVNARIAGKDARYEPNPGKRVLFVERESPLETLRPAVPGDSAPKP